MKWHDVTLHECEGSDVKRYDVTWRNIPVTWYDMIWCGISDMKWNDSGILERNRSVQQTVSGKLNYPVII